MKKGVNTGLFASLGAVTMTADWRTVLDANVIPSSRRDISPIFVMVQ